MEFRAKLLATLRAIQPVIDEPGVLVVASDRDVDELEQAYAELPKELRHAVRTNLAVLSLLEPVASMPDPTAHRARVAQLLRALEALEANS